VPIYITDFELSSTGTSRPNRNASAPAPGKKTGNAVYAETDPAPVQARRMIDMFASTLLRTFQQHGYSVTRLTGSLPTSGVLLRGIFAEPDDRNRVRVAILGSGSTKPTFYLYVGAFNLAHQDQPLYQLAVVQAPDSRYGPVITLNAYLPMTKFEVDKNPTEEDVRKICGQIVIEITKLLVQNPAAIAK
jgi:hypothetical protein